MGRPSKLTEDAQFLYERAVSAGVAPEVAARHAGFSPASLYRYLRGSTPRYVAFRQAHDRALAALEIRLTATLSKAALNDPRWALVFLERRFPERWARCHADDPADTPDGRTRPPAEPMAIVDPAFINELVPRLLEAGRQLSGRTIDGVAVDISVFEDDGTKARSTGEEQER